LCWAFSVWVCIAGSKLESRTESAKEAGSRARLEGATCDRVPPGALIHTHPFFITIKTKDTFVSSFEVRDERYSRFNS